MTNTLWPLLSLALLAASCRSSHVSSKSSNLVDIQDITLRQAQNDYDVTCRDGSREIITIDEMRRQEMCNGAGTRQETVCVSVSGGQLPSSSKTGKSFGQPMLSSECELVTAMSRFGAICGYDNGYGPYRAADGVQLGRVGSIADCVSSTNGAKRGVICGGFDGQYFMTEIATGRKYGSIALSFDTCMRVLATTTFQTVCAPTGSLYFATRISDGRAMGEGRSMQECMAANTAASPDVVCVGRGGQLVPARSADGGELGQPMSLITCTSITQNVREGALCARFNGNYYTTRIADGAKLGDMGETPESCLELMSAANHKVVCAAVGGTYVPTRIADGGKLGGGMRKQDCLTATQGIQKNIVCTFSSGGYYPTRIADGQKLGLGKTLDDCMDALRNDSSTKG